MSENMQDAFERELAKLFPGHALDELDAGLISVSKAMFFSAAEKYGPLCKSQMKATEVQPDAFAVIDHKGEIEYSVSARTETPAESLDWGRDMCHQHINDSAGSGVEGAGQWVVRPVYIGRHPAPAAVPEAATHRCKVCGALWRDNGDQSWSLVSSECGKCCDNAPMGDQIEPLPSPAPAAVPDEWREAMQHVLDWLDLCTEEEDLVCPREEYARIKKLLNAAPAPAEPDSKGDARK